jgi:hypothetical protein
MKKITAGVCMRELSGLIRSPPKKLCNHAGLGAGILTRSKDSKNFVTGRQLFTTCLCTFVTNMELNAESPRTIEGDLWHQILGKKRVQVFFNQEQDHDIKTKTDGTRY